ncbi:MAG: CDP-alcohol phosphatidyltransferase family protein, partial [Flavobacteriales bacterium]|nr:CDP-alcohol phosphatidyltransferase family protein [Flavobacteriales bacterium]
MERREAKGQSWRAWPANALTLTNLGAGALVCWWAASEFDLGWAPAEWLASLGVMESWMEITGASERRIAGIQFMLVVWITGQLCDVLDGAVARWMGADSGQGAMLDSMADLVSAGLAPSFVGLALMME